MRVAYPYFMNDEPDRVRAAAPAHAAYWRRLAALATWAGRSPTGRAG